LIQAERGACLTVEAKARGSDEPQLREQGFKLLHRPGAAQLQALRLKPVDPGAEELFLESRLLPCLSLAQEESGAQAS